MKKLLLILSLFLLFSFHQQNYAFKIGRLQYDGSGDWYANETSLPNLIAFANKQLGTKIAPKEDHIKPSSTNIFNYPYIHMTGHGNVVFSTNDAQNLRKYLTSGGFLHIDDNYGMDPFVRLEMKKVFPELGFVEVPFDHAIYHQQYHFPKGLPKIHEHDNNPAQGLALIWEGKVVCFYSYESDLGDGWEDQGVHNDPEHLRKQALQMGANILSYAFNGE
ncbi:DUF4159 domain-containing protein [Cyclobacteriaceae bacterium]|nr:DUF4159 domain-containing protein [Cyclobacteriaceae bacterium]